MYLLFGFFNQLKYILQATLPVFLSVFALALLHQGFLYLRPILHFTILSFTNTHN